MGTEILEDLEIQDRAPVRQGNGILYRARQRSRDRGVAMKVIRDDIAGDPEFIRRFERETGLLTRLYDENIVEVLGTGTWKGKLFCASEWVEGEDLRRQLEGGQRFTTEDILHIAHGVGQALATASRHDIVHRDLKPSNIFLTPQGKVKVADFGLAKDSQAGSEMLAYLSPEQSAGRTVDVRSDLYSLGAVMYELACGKPPFDGYDSEASLLYQVAHAHPSSPRELGSSIPRELERIVMRCLEKSPENRFATAVDFLSDLDQAKKSLAFGKIARAEPEDDTGDFDIFEDEVIGEGGMGTLYRGRQRSLDRSVAVKVMREAFTSNPEFVQRFLREAELLAQVNHPNVIQIFGTGTWKGRLFYAMELVQGEDLSQRQGRGHPFSAEEVLHYAEGVAHALQAAWKYKIVHRDIKPSNILQTPEGTVKVADFGLAKSLRIPRAESELIAGTADYLSPEQGLGRPVDIRSDIYSLGVVLYELAAGRPPFKWAGSTIQVIYQHVHDEPPPLRELAASTPEPIRNLIHRCLAKKPEERFQTPEDLLAEIRSARNGSTLQKTAIGSRRRIRNAVLLVAGALIAAGVWFALTTRRAPEAAGYELAMGMGEFVRAMALAESGFGRDSKEYRRAARLHREVEARRLVLAKDWDGAGAAFSALMAEAEEERKAGFAAAVDYCRQIGGALERERRGDWDGALAIYRQHEESRLGNPAFIRESIDRVLRLRGKN